MMIGRSDILVLFVLVSIARPCAAWLSDGHEKCTHTAIAAIRDTDMPAFFKEGAATIIRESTLPDAMRNRKTPHLYAAERSEHFFDLELLEGRQPPETRPEFIALCHELNVRPEKVGYLPYAVAEHMERLTIAFAEYRRWPHDASIQARCLIVAGRLAHYAQDMAQPLHLTIHFDGRGNPGTGIHKRVDALLGRIELDTEGTAETLAGHIRKTRVPEDEHFRNGMSALTFMMGVAHQDVDRVYDMEAELPSDDPAWRPTDRVRQFAQKSLNRAAQLTAASFYGAWRLSKTIELPDWLDAPTTQPVSP